MSNIPAVDMSILLQIHGQIERQGVDYGLGAKADFTDNPGDFDEIDCSGYVRWLLYKATDGRLKIVDGSQNQRAWAEANLRKVAYRDAAEYMTAKRLFIAFIKPNTNGCGSVGHVWLLCSLNDKDGIAETIESHGGHGPNSRPWNTGVLLREVFECFELPCAG